MPARVSDDQIRSAIRVLEKGGIVAFPTDTVYGIGAHAFIDSAVARIYEVKERPRHMALPLLIADKAELTMIASQVPELAWRLAERFLPGGLTLVLWKNSSLHSAAAAGDTVAVRIPNHPIPIALIRGLGAPLTGTSANLSGKPSSVTAKQVSQQLGDKLDLIIDGGRCPGGIESTIVDVTGEMPRIVREGALSREEIGAVLGVLS